MAGLRRRPIAAGHPSLQSGSFRGPIHHVLDRRAEDRLEFPGLHQGQYRERIARARLGDAARAAVDRDPARADHIHLQPGLLAHHAHAAAGHAGRVCLCHLPDLGDPDVEPVHRGHHPRRRHVRRQRGVHQAFPVSQGVPSHRHRRRQPGGLRLPADVLRRRVARAGPLSGVGDPGGAAADARSRRAHHRHRGPAGDDQRLLP